MREVNGEEIREAMMEAIATAVDDIVRQQQIPINYRVQLSMNSKEFHHAYSSTIFNLKEWFARSDRVQGLLEHLAKKLNSNESFNPQVGFDVALMFISQVNPGSGRKLKKDKTWTKSVGQIIEEEKMCDTNQKQRRHLFSKGYIITMKKKCAQGSHWVNLRNRRPIQERLAKLLHQEASVPDGPCDLVPQGYQIVVVCAQNAVILFKDAQYNQSLTKFNW